jgi:hypothetical protein
MDDDRHGMCMFFIVDMNPLRDDEEDDADDEERTSSEEFDLESDLDLRRKASSIPDPGDRLPTTALHPGTGSTSDSGHSDILITMLFSLWLIRATAAAAPSRYDDGGDGSPVCEKENVVLWSLPVEREGMGCESLVEKRRNSKTADFSQQSVSPSLCLKQQQQHSAQYQSQQSNRGNV